MQTVIRTHEHAQLLPEPGTLRPKAEIELAVGLHGVWVFGVMC